MPIRMMGATFISLRLPIVAAFLLFAAVDLRAPRRVTTAVLAGAALLFVVRMAYLTQV